MILFAYNACRLLSLTVLTSLPPQQVPFFLTDLFPISRSFCFIDCPSWITEGSLAPGSLGRGACCTVHPKTESTGLCTLRSPTLPTDQGPGPVQPEHLWSYSLTWGYHHLLSTHLPLPKMSVTQAHGWVSEGWAQWSGKPRQWAVSKHVVLHGVSPVLVT